MSEENMKLAHVYRILAKAMHYPDKKWLNEEYLSVLSSLLEQLLWTKDLKQFQENVVQSNFVDDLQVEYTRLFINAVPNVVAPPYGSIYLSADGSLMSQSTEKTKDFYRQNGFELSTDNEIADSLVNELECMALLAEANKTSELEVFLNDHFRTWFHTFSDKVIEGAELPFYQTAVTLIDFFTQEEF